MTIFPNVPRRVASALMVSALAAACTEPRHTDAAAPRPVATLEPRVEVSNVSPIAGSTVTVTVRYAGPAVASTTARLAFDSTAFAFAGEEPLDDGGTRVINPSPGLVRFAALAANGFTKGTVYTMRFTALRAAPAAFALSVDEAHTPAGGDARAGMTKVAP